MITGRGFVCAGLKKWPVLLKKQRCSLIENTRLDHESARLCELRLLRCALLLIGLTSSEDKSS